MMRKLIFALVLTGAMALVVSSVESDERFDYDVAIRGGTLYLGGMTMGGIGDVAVKGDRIVAVGKAPGRARREINGGGMIVSPGFIDLHTHCDIPFKMLGRFPIPGSMKANLNYITQGVTTVISGNCGSGIFTKEGIDRWFNKIEKMPFGSNLIHLFPHGDVRLEVMGKAQAMRPDPKPTSEEMQKMKELLDAGMRAGTWGISTGLEYDPGARADTGELVELNKVVARHGGVYASHIRQEGPDPDKLIASIEEAIAVGERAGTPVQISHIKCSGNQAHGMSFKVIEVVEAARARGVRVTADQYPYPAGSTTLSVMVPPDKRDGTKVLKQYCTREGRKKLYKDVAHSMATATPADATMVSLYPWKPWLQGKTIAQIAKKRGKDPVEVAIDLACGPIGAGIYFNQNEQDLKNFMKRNWVATGSDGSTFLKILGNTHPRFYGAFPRKIRKYVFEQKLITLPFALRSMTELPAKAFDIPKRGKLAPGYFADIVAFDPKTIRDHATWEEPCQYSEGIEYLLVNGVLSIDKGKYTGKRGGRALRHGK